MPSNGKPARLDRSLLRLAGVLLVGAIAALIDTTIVGVALDSIGRDFVVTEAAVSWVSTSYLLSLALVTPLVGWGVDRFGAKRMWMVAVAVFLGGSILCGLSWSIGSLIAFRALKGLGGGMLLPLVQAILAQAAGPERFGRVMSIVSVPGLLAPVFGPVVGGFLVQSVGWRAIFFVNVPICLLALALAARYLPSDGAGRTAPLDRRGLLLLPPGLVLLVYAFSRVTENRRLDDPLTLAVLVVGIGMVVGFGVHALRAAHPLVDLRLFRVRSFAAGSTLVFLNGVASYGPLFVLPLFYARVRGHDAAEVGLLLAPQGVGTMVTVLVAGLLADRFGARPLVLAGTAAGALGTVAFTQLASGPSDVLLTASLFVRGLGLGLVGVAVLTGAYRDLPDGTIARATGGISIVQRLGASFGTAVIAVVLAIGLATPGNAETSAYSVTFGWMLGLMLISFVPALLMPRRRPAAQPEGSEEPEKSEPSPADRETRSGSAT